MTRKLSRLLLLAMLIVALPLSSWAFGLDLTVRAGGGLAMGSTDDENKTGMPGFAVGGGAGIDLSLLELSPVTVGLSTGLEYLYLRYESEIELGGPVLTSDSNYSYLTFPLTLKAGFPVTENLTLAGTAGGFAGYFLGGTSDNTTDPPSPFDGEVDLEGEIEEWQFGLRLGLAAEIMGRGRVSVEPGLLFDLGLTDTTITQPSRDTFWALTAYVGCRYSLF